DDSLRAAIIDGVKDINEATASLRTDLPPRLARNSARSPPTSPCWPPRSIWPASVRADYIEPPANAGKSRRHDSKTLPHSGFRTDPDNSVYRAGTSTDRTRHRPTPAVTTSSTARAVPPTPRDPFDRLGVLAPKRLRTAPTIGSIRLIVCLDLTRNALG